MKINNKDVSAIRLHYKGTDLKFQHIAVKGYVREEETRISEIPLIEFDDTREVEIAIAMLNEFLSRCKSSLGNWKKENEHDGERN